MDEIHHIFYTILGTYLLASIILKCVPRIENDTAYYIMLQQQRIKCKVSTCKNPRLFYNITDYPQKYSWGENNLYINACILYIIGTNK